MSNSLILKDVSKSYNSKSGELSLFQNINISFKAGTSYGIKGLSGSGKSTLLNIICGLEKASSGSIFINENIFDITNDSCLSVILKDFFGIVFQNPYLINNLTVLENIALKDILYTNISQKSIDKIFQLTNSLNLFNKQNYFPDNLSGGEQQRVSIARALFNVPKFLICDEPTSNLDTKNIRSFLDLILKLKYQENMGIIIVSHDENVLGSMDYVFELKEGFLRSVSV